MIRMRSLRAGEMRVTASPARLIIHGLGSCVAVFLFDPGSQVGGLDHILLPGPAKGPTDRPGRYATTAVAAMVEDAVRLGARRSALQAKVTGGSRMFLHEIGSDHPTVGDKNVDAARRALQAAGVTIVASDVGGDQGRTVVANLQDGTLEIKSVRGGSRIV